MTRDEALYWFHLGRHGCEGGVDEMTAFDSLWGSRFKEVEVKRWDDHDPYDLENSGVEEEYDYCKSDEARNDLKAVGKSWSIASRLDLFDAICGRGIDTWLHGSTELGQMAVDTAKDLGLDMSEMLDRLYARDDVKELGYAREPRDEWTVNAVCDGNLHVVGNESSCNECGFTCNWLHEPRSHKPIAVERSEDKVDDSPVDPVVDVAAETVDLERCGGRLIPHWRSTYRGCCDCQKLYSERDAASIRYRCTELV